MKYIIAALAFIAVELLYFWIAKRFHIVDRPNERSSHHKVILLGGGIIFPISVIYFSATQHWAYPWFIIGVLLVAIVSYIDDLKGLPSWFRFGIQLIAIFLVLFQFSVFHLDMWKIILVFFVTLGTVNIYNFMDGINGMLAAYSLVVLSSLAYVNAEVLHFVDSDLIIFSMTAVAVFAFFNFRKKARCFSGDVGSIVMGCIVLFLIGRLVQASPTGNPELTYLVFIGIYLADGGLTILKRLLRGENIFKPHREHLYETLCNDLRVPHLTVASSYALAQLVINVLYFLVEDKLLYTVVVAVVLVFGYSLFFLCFNNWKLKQG